MRPLLLALLIALGLIPCAAQSDPVREARAAKLWQSLTPEQRELVRRNWPRYEALSAEQRAVLDARWISFDRLTPSRRQAVIARFKSLGPARDRSQPSLKRGVAAGKSDGIEERRSRQRERPLERGRDLREERAERRRGGLRRR